MRLAASWYPVLQSSELGRKPVALQRFGERLTPGEVTEQRPVPRSPAARERAIKRAEKELDRIGI